MPSWPSTLPQIANLSVSKTRQSAKLRTPMDAGLPKQRAKYTGAIKNYSASMVLTGAEVVIFESFYESDLSQGSLAFNWLDLSSRTFAQVRFINEYELSVIKGDSDSDDCDWLLSFELEVLPGQALFWKEGDGESLYMDFITKEYAWRPFDLEKFYPGFKTSNLRMIGFSRNYEGSYINEDGLISFVDVDFPAYTFDEDGNNIGLTILDEHDNIIDESENFDNWTAPAGITRTSNFVAAPFEGEPITAYKIEKDAATFRNINKVLITPTVNFVYTFVCIVKQFDLNNVSLLLTGDNGVTVHGRATFDFTTELLTDAGSTNLINSFVVKLGLGYYAIAIAATLTNVSDPRTYIYPGIYNGTTAGSIIVAAAFCSRGQWGFPYVRTAGAAGLKLRDFLNKDDLGEINPDEGTIYWEGILYRHPTSPTQVPIIRICNNPLTFSNTLVGIQYSEAGLVRMFWRTDSTSGFTNLGGAYRFNSGDLVKVAISYKKGGQIIGSVQGQSASSASFPSGDVFTEPLKIAIGDTNASGGTGAIQYEARYVSKVKYYPVQKLAAELEVITS